MSARILIVDDTPLNIKLLAAKLAHDYYIVSSAANGVEALEKVANDRPDLILLDVMMPEMDGFEACRRLKANPATAHIPVIIITALSDIADRVRGLAEGADDFLSKPINNLALMARIRSLLRLKVLMDEWRLREETAQQFSPTPIIPIDQMDISHSRLLIVDDNPTDNEFICQTLKSVASRIDEVDGMKAMETVLIENSYDLVFLNLNLINEDALMICSHLRTAPATRHVPILMLSNNADMERIAKGLDLGANDYLIRPFETAELYARARTQLRQKHNYDRLRHGFEKNIMMSLVDPLTGCFNRRYLDAHMPRFLQHTAAKRQSLSVQMLDIDHFKKINDAYGHAAGDAVLKEVSRRVSNGVRPSDSFVRMGGEEFAIVMPETTLSNATKIAERLRQSVSNEPFSVPGSEEPIKVTISIGTANTCPEMNGTTDDVFERADAALYRAKQSGRNQVSEDETGARNPQTSVP